MKKSLCLFCALCMTLLLCSCGISDDIPAGYTASAEHFDPEPTQDHTDYGKYTYPSGEPFTNNGDYHIVGAGETEAIMGYFTNFGDWMETQNRTGEYDFDPACITAGDYVRIVTKEGDPVGNSRYGKYDNYSVYLFDTDSLTLFYIHSNI